MIDVAAFIFGTIALLAIMKLIGGYIPMTNLNSIKDG